MSRHFEDINDRFDYIEFRQELLFTNSDLDRLLFEYEITRFEYRKIMDLMEKYRNAIGQNKSVNHGTFEGEIYAIVPTHRGEYHMCEYLARAFMDEGRWDEVFPALYGDMSKYKFLKDNKK